MGYYKVGEDYKLRGVYHKVVSIEYCKHAGVSDEICVFCDGKVKFDNGEVICGWMENKKLFWVPMWPKKGDKDETGLEYD
jgi:hypothetical protein